MRRALIIASVVVLLGAGCPAKKDAVPATAVESGAGNTVYASDEYGITVDLGGPFEVGPAEGTVGFGGKVPFGEGPSGDTTVSKYQLVITPFRSAQELGDDLSEASRATLSSEDGLFPVSFYTLDELCEVPVMEIHGKQFNYRFYTGACGADGDRGTFRRLLTKVTLHEGF